MSQRGYGSKRMSSGPPRRLARAIGTEELLAWLSVYQLSREMIPREIVEVLWHD